MCLSMVAFLTESIRNRIWHHAKTHPDTLRPTRCIPSWVTVNDNVGGRSIGDFTIKEGKLVFRAA